MLLPPPLSVLFSSLLPFLCDSLILCPSYGLRVSPHFIDSVGALPYPSPELHFAWPIPIRQRPCHEQKRHCDQACIQLPMSLLALAAPACCACCMTVWTGLRFLSLVGRGRARWMWMIQFRAEGVDDRIVCVCVWRGGILDTNPEWGEFQTGCSFPKTSYFNYANMNPCAGITWQTQPL